MRPTRLEVVVNRHSRLPTVCGTFSAQADFVSEVALGRPLIEGKAESAMGSVSPSLFVGIGENCIPDCICSIAAA
jgi:hypothetical protein